VYVCELCWTTRCTLCNSTLHKPQFNGTSFLVASCSKCYEDVAITCYREIGRVGRVTRTLRGICCRGMYSYTGEQGPVDTLTTKFLSVLFVLLALIFNDSLETKHIRVYCTNLHDFFHQMVCVCSSMNNFLSTYRPIIND